MPDDHVLDIKVGPFLRWTGSKRWFTQEFIDNYLPRDFNSYHEPFLGGGAVFFYLKTLNDKNDRRFYLSDINLELINCYKQIRDDLPSLIRKLRKLKNSESEYYKIRESRPNSDSGKAAKFLYLNRTSFNGIYRVNSLGAYNVPYGYRKNVDLVTKELFESVKCSFSNTIFKQCGFEKTIKSINANDLVFIDPPYTVAHENNGFIEYNQKLFSWKDQLRLKKFVEKIQEKGAYFILTNACHSSIKDLYKNLGRISTVSRLSKVGGRNKTRGEFKEFVIYNTR